MANAIPVGRIFEGFSFALSNGIKPVSTLLQNKCVHTRLETEYERLNRKNAERINSEIEAKRCRQQRQNKNACIARNICAMVRRMEMEVNRKELQNLEARREQWRGFSTIQEHKFKKVSDHVLDLTEAVETFEQIVETITAERDEVQALLAREREEADGAEKLRKVAVSSLRHRCEQEKALILDEIQDLREALRKKDHKIAQLNDYCEESVQHIETLDRQIALHESSEAMGSLSREVSGTLSEMSEVVLLRQDDRESVDEKMRDLRDGIKDLVREVKNRRQHSERLNEHIYKLEEERMMWSEGS